MTDIGSKARERSGPKSRESGAQRWAEIGNKRSEQSAKRKVVERERSGERAKSAAHDRSNLRLPVNMEHRVYTNKYIDN